MPRLSADQQLEPHPRRLPALEFRLDDGHLGEVRAVAPRDGGHRGARLDREHRGAASGEQHGRLAGAGSDVDDADPLSVVRRRVRQRIVHQRRRIRRPRAVVKVRDRPGQAPLGLHSAKVKHVDGAPSQGRRVASRARMSRRSRITAAVLCCLSGRIAGQCDHARERVRGPASASGSPPRCPRAPARSARCRARPTCTSPLRSSRATPPRAPLTRGRRDPRLERVRPVPDAGAVREPVRRHAGGDRGGPRRAAHARAQPRPGERERPRSRSPQPRARSTKRCPGLERVAIPGGERGSRPGRRPRCRPRSPPSSKP